VRGCKQGWGTCGRLGQGRQGRELGLGCKILELGDKVQEKDGREQVLGDKEQVLGDKE